MLRTAALLLLGVELVAVGLISSPGPVAAAAPTSRYAPISPVRVMDTRAGLGATRMSPSSEVTVRVVTSAVASAAGVAVADVTAVVLNVTSVDAQQAGYLSLYPNGETRPNASVLNPERAGQVLANTVTARVSSAGEIRVFNAAGGHVLIDVQGVYVAAGSATSGRLVPFTPVRALDTRATGAPLAAGEIRTIDLLGAGVPTTASAAVINLTVTQTKGGGYFTVWPGTGDAPNASNLNVERAGQTIANQVITGVSGGTAKLFTTLGAHVIVDVAGYFTGAGAPASETGLFVPMTPWRLTDTRGTTSLGSGVPIGAGGIIESGLGQLPANGAAAVALNVTMTAAQREGYVAVYPARTQRPEASSVNASASGQTIANHVLVPLSDYGVGAFADTGSHVIIDVAGYFTGAPQTGSTTPAQPSAPPATGPHAFMFGLADGKYARWDPCSPIQYVVNDDAVSAAHRSILDGVIADVEAATGLDLVYAGETSSFDKIPPAGANAIISFNPSNFAAANVLGRAGAYFTTSGRVQDGSVMVRADIPADALLREVLLHEIAHMVGLDHVDASTEVMYPVAQGKSSYAAGDREGLWRLGSAQGCLASSGSANGVEDLVSVYRD